MSLTLLSKSVLNEDFGDEEDVNTNNLQYGGSGTFTQPRNDDYSDWRYLCIFISYRKTCVERIQSINRWTVYRIKS